MKQLMLAQAGRAPKTSQGFTLLEVMLAFVIFALSFATVLEIVAGYANQRRLERMDTGFRGPDFDRGALWLLFLGRMPLLVAGLGVVAYMVRTARRNPASGAEAA